jgi:hypothetical protein
MPRSSVLLICVAAVIAYASIPWILLSGGSEAAGLIIWTTSPLSVPLLVVAFARGQRTRAIAAILLACLWIVGAALLLWGLVLNPGDYNHLVGIFLPIYMFAFIAAAAAAMALALVRALVRRFAN